jgi:hypothetical protein
MCLRCTETLWGCYLTVEAIEALIQGLSDQLPAEKDLKVALKKVRWTCNRFRCNVSLSWRIIFVPLRLVIVLMSSVCQELELMKKPTFTPRGRRGRKPRQVLMSSYQML